MAEDDWDLTAIVRSCTTSPAAPNEESDPHNPLTGLTFEAEPDPFAFPDLSHTGFHELLQDSYDNKPFSSGQRNLIIPPPPLTPKSSDFAGQSQRRTAVSPRVVVVRNNQQQTAQDLGNRHQRQMQGCSSSGYMGSGSSNLAFSFSSSLRSMQSQPATVRPRKKKNNQKRLVVQVTADNLSNDVWAWRKYGQKPIKGSPYPRNYYRCSSTKGCGARKQVERSTTDPNMFIISYAGDHTHPKPTHRNSLAGSTRTKFPLKIEPGGDVSSTSAPPPTLQTITTSHGKKPAACSSPAAGSSPTTPLSATMDHEAAVNSRTATADHEMMTRITSGDHVADLQDQFESGDDDDANVGEFGYSLDDDEDDDVDDGNFIRSSNNNNDNNNTGFGDDFSSWIFGNSSSTGGGGC